jgi:hypothetical protein
MRKVMLFLVMLLISSNCYAARLGPEASWILAANDSQNMFVDTTNTTYSKAFSLKDCEYFSIGYKGSGEGVANVTVQLEQSWSLPTTEGASDTSYVIPSGASDILTAQITNGTWVIKSLSPVPTPYGRFKIIGNATNINTTINMILMKQEK